MNLTTKGSRVSKLLLFQRNHVLGLNFGSKNGSLGIQLLQGQIHEKTIFSIALLSLSSPVFAESGFPIDLLAGNAEQDVSTPRVEAFNVASDDTSFGLRATYNISRYFGAELGYQNYGEVNRVFTDNNGLRIENGFKLDATNLGIKGMLPVGEKISINARVGLSIWDLDFARKDDMLPGEKFTNKADGEDLYYGVGVSYQALDRILVGLEYTVTDADLMFDATTDTFEGTNDVRNLTLALGLTF